MDDLEDLSQRRAMIQNQLDPTLARPEPWFVGGGSKLMVAVLVVVALLIVLRGVSTVWMIEDIWAWWAHRPVVGASPTLPPPPLIDPKRASTGASAIHDEAQWITVDDYPSSSIRANEQGTTTVKWTIGVNGLVSDCRATVSSGYQALDDAACRALVRRGAYQPARDAAGRAIVSTKSRRVRWVLPDNGS